VTSEEISTIDEASRYNNVLDFAKLSLNTPLNNETTSGGIFSPIS
jgi:hypothetical protein